MLTERRLTRLATAGRLGDTVKRTFDLVLATVGLIISMPLWGVIALAIKLEDGGPLFYRQQRVGRRGRYFQSVKFRTMVADADMRYGPRQAKPDDERITRIGRFLRATAMDELLQLWNIVRGDMSFVGPRALAPGEIEVNGPGVYIPLEAIPGYEARHRIRPGLTGIAQIFAARDIPRWQKFRYDLLYVARRTLWLDLRLIALSFWITVRGTWESRSRKF